MWPTCYQLSRKELCLRVSKSLIDMRFFPSVSVVKNSPANAGDKRDAGSILGLGRTPGGGNGNPLQYSCLENPVDRGAWWATVHRVAKSQIQIKQLSTHAHTTDYFKHVRTISLLLALLF